MVTATQDNLDEVGSIFNEFMDLLTMVERCEDLDDMVAEFIENCRGIRMRTDAEKLVLLWALDAPITGRGDAVRNARRVLMYVSAGARADHGGEWKAHYVRIPELVKALKMPRQTVYRSLNRLLDQGLLLEVNKWRGLTRSFQLGYTPPQDAQKAA